MADDKKRKYYDSLVQSGVVPPEVSYETFVSRVSGDKNYSDIVYSGLETASKLGVVEGIPDKKTFESVLRTFPTKPELKKDNFGRQVPDAGEATTDESSVNITIPPSTPTTGGIGTPSNQPQPTAEETQIAPLQEESGFEPIQGGQPLTGEYTDDAMSGLPLHLRQQQTPISGDVLANAPQQQFQWSGQQVQGGQPQVQAQMPQTREQGAQDISQEGTPLLPQEAYDRPLNYTGKFIGTILRDIPKFTFGEPIKGIAQINRFVFGNLGIPQPSTIEEDWMYQAGQTINDAADYAMTQGAQTRELPSQYYKKGVYAFSKEETQDALVPQVATAFAQILPMALTGGGSKTPQVVNYLSKGSKYISPAMYTIINAANRVFDKSAVVSTLQVVSQLSDDAGKAWDDANNKTKEQYVSERVLNEGATRSEAEETYDLLKGKTRDEVVESTFPLAITLAQMEKLPLEAMFKWVPENTYSRFANMGLTGGVGYITERLQESVQTGVENIAVSQLYDKTRSTMAGVDDAGKVGGTAGLFMGLVIGGLKKRRAKIKQQVESGEITQEEAVKEAEEVNKTEAFVNDKVDTFESSTAMNIPAVKEIRESKEAQTFFDSNEASLTNPITTMPTQVETIMDKIDGGILISAESLHEAYQWTNNAVREVMQNKALSDAEKGATLNILNGMLTDIDKANTEGQRFVEQVEEVSVQDRLPAVREGVKPLPQGQAPKGTATPSIAQAKTIREENKKKQAGTNVLPSSGQTIVTPAPATINIQTPKGFTQELKNLGYSDEDISKMSFEQQQEIVTNKTEKPEVVSSVSLSQVDENAKKSRINEIETMLASDAKSMADTGMGMLIPEAKVELQNELSQLKQQTTTEAVATEAEVVPDGTIAETRTESDFANENESYRVIVGDEAFNDIVESGVVRTNADNKGANKVDGEIDLSNRPTAYPSFSRGKASMEYANANPNNYIIVTEDASIQPSKSGRHGKGTTMFPTDENGKHLKELSGEKVKVYKHIGDGKYELVYANGKPVNNSSQTTTSPQAQAEVTAENRALADVESTAKALEGVDITDAIPPQEINAFNKKLYNDLLNKQSELLSKGIRDFQNNPEWKAIKDQISFSEALINNDSKAISSAYHKAKADGSNPELVQAVEQLLTPTQDAVQKQTAGQVPVQSGTTSSQEVAKGEPQAEPQSTADKGQTQETGKEEVGDKVQNIASEYGWTATPTEKGGYEFSNRNGKKVAIMKVEKGRNVFYDSEGKNKLGSDSNLERGVDDLIGKYFLGKKQTPTTTPTPTAETVATTGETTGQEGGEVKGETKVQITPVNATDVETITKIENATEKGRELALNKPTNKGLKRAFDNFQDLSSRAKKAGIYDGKTLKIGGQEIILDTPAKFKAFLANQGNFDAISEAVGKSEIDTLKSERDSLIQQFKKEMGKATMNLNPQQVSLLAQIAWKNLQILLQQTKLSSAGIASQIKKVVDEAILQANQMLAQSGQTSLNPDKDDITNIINGVRKLAEGIVVPPSQNAGQIGTAGQPSATQSPVYTKEQEELARQMEKKMDEGKPFIARSEPFWTAVKRKVAELRQKLDSPKELLNFAEKMIGTSPGSSYKTTRELPLGRAMEQLRGKARALALPYMERISDILKPIEKNLPDFEKYLIYRRIIDRAIQDKLNQDAYNQGLLKKKPKRRTTGGMTETNADILLNDLRNKIGADLFDKFTQAGDELQQVFDDNLKDLVDAGVLTQDRYNAIKAQNEFYVPFDVVQRDFRGNVITGTEYDRSTAQGQKVIQEIEGIKTPKNAAEADGFIGVVYKMMQNGDIDVDSYYYLATDKITDARNAGNITQQEYEDIMDSLSEPGLELHSPLNKTLNIINASQYQVARQGYMNDIDRLVDADTNNDYFKRLEDGDKLPSGMAIITYYKDGVQQRVAVDEKLKQAIDTMTNPELNAIEKILKSVSFPFKIAATSASITFLPVNFVIDLTRSLTSKAGLGSGATVTERAASVVQIPVIYSEALMNAIIGNLLNTKLGNVLNLKSITPNFMHEQYEDWRKSPSYSEGSYLGHLVDRLKSGRTKSEIEDAKFLETIQRRTQTILGNEKTAKAIANAVLGTKQKTRMTVDGVMDIVNLISKMLENSHKIYGYTKLSGTETGVRKGIDRYIGGYIDKLHGRKKLTQAELENALDEVTDEVLNNIGSPNFEQIPPNMRAASVIVPFLGAAVKGNMSDVSRVLNSVNAGASKKERLDALAFTARNGAVFLVPAFITGLTMALKDDDDESKKMYDEMDENSKWSNSIFPIERNVDGKEGQFDFITVPIRGVPVIFNSIGRASGQALGMAMKEKLTKEELKNISKDVLLSSFSSMMAFNLADKTYLSNIDPETGERKETRKEEEWINRSMSFASGLNPVIKYIPERLANKNFFGKYSIEPENIRGRRLRNAILNEVIDPATGKPISPSVLKNKFTPDYAVTLSKYFERNGVRMSPMIIDHLFDTFLAGAPEKFDVGASELMKRRFLWKERKLAYGQKPKN